ncbi:MAG: membrane protein insertion efficiency factor YidD [Chloroflexi bacterium]|nr:membrane protein insertion efficiency factor YidD [Ktedonobacteraceae bacterium]MBV9021214.1 membrane protein insertion efficiency factor YidD [Ktedonobacteraceae bacterium]MBV9709182.1 membrane protein insertion efficiency factor YidD [Chloroflexota bacterium]
MSVRYCSGHGSATHSPSRATEHAQRLATVKYIALALIRLYQRTLSVVLPPSCRFIPSCSQYGYEAIQRFGFFRGGWMTIKRISRCHPFYHGDLYDPVPELQVSEIKEGKGIVPWV